MALSKIPNYLQDSLTSTQMPSGSVVQVTQTIKTDTFSTNALLSSGGTIVTGLSASITPNNSANKILITAVLNVDGEANITQVYSWLARGSTKIGVGDTSGSRIGVGGRFYYADNNVSGMLYLTFLDSPNTTSSTTYNVYIASENSSGIVTVNRCINDTNNTTNGARGSSTITLMEIAG